MIELYLTHAGHVWIASLVSQLPPAFCHCPACQYCLYAIGAALWRLCTFLRSCWGIHIRAWTPIRRAVCRSHPPQHWVCPDAVVTALSATSTAETQTCLAFCFSRSHCSLAALMRWLDMLHVISLNMQHALMVTKAHEFALNSLWIVTS